MPARSERGRIGIGFGNLCCKQERITVKKSLPTPVLVALLSAAECVGRQHVNGRANLTDKKTDTILKYMTH
jgi:hypothetical protein